MTRGRQAVSAICPLSSPSWKTHRRWWSPKSRRSSVSWTPPLVLGILMLVSGSYLIVFLQTTMHALEQELPNGNTLGRGHSYMLLIFRNFPNGIWNSHCWYFYLRVLKHIYKSILCHYLASKTRAKTVILWKKTCNFLLLITVLKWKLSSLNQLLSIDIYCNARCRLTAITQWTDYV